jgi:hypothetical protein
MMGRPTKWSEELEAKALEYVKNWQNTGKDVVPSIVGLCSYINVAKSTIYKWADENKGNFSDIVSQINESQEQHLMGGGLKGDYNASIAKLMLTKHGYHDKVEQDNKSSDGSMSPINADDLVDAIRQVADYDDV